MNINATMLIQAFNFFITYWMLRLFLFKPIIAIIDHENADKKALLDIIDQQQKSIAIQEKELQRHWHVCQEYFALHKPSYTSHQFVIVDQPKEIPTIVHETSAEDITRIVIEVHNRLEEKIKHVH